MHIIYVSCLIKRSMEKFVNRYVHTYIGHVHISTISSTYICTVEPVNPDSGKSGHLHLTDIKLLSRIFLHLKLVFRYLKIWTPLYSVIRTAIYSPVTSLVRKIACIFRTVLNNIIFKTGKNALSIKKQHIDRI